MIGDFNPGDFEWDDTVGWMLKQPLIHYLGKQTMPPVTDDPQKEIASVVRNAVIDTLKASAPGISEPMRSAIAQSVVLKVKKVFGP